MKQLRLILFLSLSILFAHEGDHQHTHKGKRGATGCIIYGTVIDSVTNLPIEYASISIINSEGEVITGGVSDELGDLQDMVNSFATHVSEVYNLEMFYGDEVLGNLISHSKGLLGILEDFREIYSLFDEDSETQETGEEDITEEVPIDAVTQTEKKTQKGKTLFYEGA